jgi:hypothetical protein
MVKPQQPELRRSDRGATSDDAAKPRLTAPHTPGVDGPGGRGVPEENAPGHHPDHEQDKPSGRDFVAKTHALASSDEYEAPSADNEVLDLTQVETDRVHGHKSPVDRAISIAGTSVGIGMKVAGTGIKVAGAVYREARKRLPRS